MITTQDLPMVDTDDMDDFTLALHSLIIDMQYEGYQCRARFPEVEALDGDIISHMACTRCGGALHYQPFYKAKINSYRAFAVCTECGKVREF